MSWLVSVAERRAGLLIFTIPLILVQILLRPLFHAEHDWADFAFTLIFFLAGYILYSDGRFVAPIKRDAPIMLVIGILSTGFFFATGAMGVAMDWAVAVGTPQFFLLWIIFAINSWCWTLFVLNLGMRTLDFTNQWLRYGQEMIMPFFLVHQPVILLIAFFVVPLKLGLMAKLLLVVVPSFLVSMGIYELIIKRIKPLRRILGVR